MKVKIIKGPKQNAKKWHHALNGASVIDPNEPFDPTKPIDLSKLPNISAKEDVVPELNFSPAQYLTDAKVAQQSIGNTNFQPTGNIMGDNQSLPTTKMIKQPKQKKNFDLGKTVAGGLLAIDMMMPSEQIKMNYPSPANAPYYNPYPSGTGSSALMEDGGQISPEKAKQILHDGTIRGKRITNKQRKYFGAMSNMADGGDIAGDPTKPKPLSREVVDSSIAARREAGLPLKGFMLTANEKGEPTWITKEDYEKAHQPVLKSAETPSTPTTEAPSKKLRFIDTRDIQDATGLPVKKGGKPVEVEEDYIRNIVKKAKKAGVDPYNALAMAYQESRFGNSEGGRENPFHISREYDDDYSKLEKKHGGDEVAMFMDMLKSRTDYAAKKLHKKGDAELLQSYNGYGKLTPNSEDKSDYYYGINVREHPIDMAKNPIYGKTVVDIRDNIIKKNPDLVNIINEPIPQSAGLGSPLITTPPPPTDDKLALGGGLPGANGMFYQRGGGDWQPKSMRMGGHFTTAYADGGDIGKKPRYAAIQVGDPSAMQATYTVDLNSGTKVKRGDGKGTTTLYNSVDANGNRQMLSEEQVAPYLNSKNNYGITNYNTKGKPAGTDSLYLAPGASPSSIHMFEQGGSVYEQGGELQLYSPDSQAAHLSPSIVKFQGKEHGESNAIGSEGIPLQYGGNPVEVENDETGYSTEDGGFTVLGKMKNPLSGRMFKNDGKVLAAKEAKASKQLVRGTNLMDSADTQNPFELLKFNSGKAKTIGAKAKAEQVNQEKETLAALQQHMLDFAEQNNLDPNAMSKGKIKTAKFGIRMPIAENGITTPRHGQRDVDPSGNTFVYDGNAKKWLDDATFMKNNKKFGKGYGTMSDEDLVKGLKKIGPAKMPYFKAPGENYDLSAPAGYEDKPFTDRGADIEGIENTPIFSPTGGMNQYAEATTGSKNDESKGVTFKNLPTIAPQKNDLMFKGADWKNYIKPAYVLATNKKQPIRMAPLPTPALEQSYQGEVDLNPIVANTRAMQQSLGGNAAEAATATALANQQIYQAQSQGFAANQDRTAGVFARNRQAMNEYGRTAASVAQTQADRQAQMEANTRAMTRDALGQFGEIDLQNKRDWNNFNVQKQMFPTYGVDPNYQLKVENPYNFNIPEGYSSDGRGGWVDKHGNKVTLKETKDAMGRPVKSEKTTKVGKYGISINREFKSYKP
ncbi:MAG: hypothetical protein WCP46_00010 [Alphaproteobacteria bacterium]